MLVIRTINPNGPASMVPDIQAGDYLYAIEGAIASNMTMMQVMIS
jgi:hypothetical protein